jgi:hypothetical protein
MLDALVNFAMMNVAFIVVATIVGVYALVRLTTNAKSTSAQLDVHTREQLAAIDRDRAAAHESMDIHPRV